MGQSGSPTPRPRATMGFRAASQRCLPPGPLHPPCGGTWTLFHAGDSRGLPLWTETALSEITNSRQRELCHALFGVIDVQDTDMAIEGRVFSLMARTICRGSTRPTSSTTLLSVAMSKRKRHAKQASMWVATEDLPRTAAHPFYSKLNQILDTHDFDGDVEGLCQQFYATRKRVRPLQHRVRKGAPRSRCPPREYLAHQPAASFTSGGLITVIDNRSDRSRPAPQRAKTQGNMASLGPIFDRLSGHPF